METRNPVFAGKFYPSDRSTLEREVREMLVPALKPPRQALGVMVPHAGYIYSGSVAGGTFASITPPATAVLLGPNHSGTGAPVAMWNSGRWSTPLGEASVDSALANSLSLACKRLVPDRQAHFNEHSLEVQVPFLQVINPGVKIVPLMFQAISLEILREIGRAIAGSIRESSPRPLLVASSDMNHFESHGRTLEKDAPVLDAILALDVERMWREVRDGRVSMCGIAPMAVMLEAARELGATRVDLTGHTTSGPVSGDYERTVGYAGVIIS